MTAQQGPLESAGMAPGSQQLREDAGGTALREGCATPHTNLQDAQRAAMAAQIVANIMVSCLSATVLVDTSGFVATTQPADSRSAWSLITIPMHCACRRPCHFCVVTCAKVPRLLCEHPLFAESYLELIITALCWSCAGERACAGVAASTPPAATTPPAARARRRRTTTTQRPVGRG